MRGLPNKTSQYVRRECLQHKSAFAQIKHVTLEPEDLDFATTYLYDLMQITLQIENPHYEEEMKKIAK